MCETGARRAVVVDDHDGVGVVVDVDPARGCLLPLPAFVLERFLCLLRLGGVCRCGPFRILYEEAGL